MGMYQRVELMKINGLLDMPLNEIIYVYKLTSVHTGHYYIGQTGSVKDRMYQHLSAIVKYIEGTNNTTCQQFHKFIGQKIIELHQKDKRVKIERFTREALSVYIIALVGDKEAANLVESHYIKKHFKDPMCLNKNG